MCHYQNLIINRDDCREKNCNFSTIYRIALQICIFIREHLCNKKF